ncbi:MAG TPA: flippase-like domain-containing protein, partial [Polyangiaceae bacterium]|nr:flippase-like domain-containing protein [Polyangiaceae bacterium]
MATLFFVIALSIAVALGAAASYAWLSETDAFATIAEHAPALALGVAIAITLTLLNLLLRWLRWNFLLRRFHALVPTRETFRLFFSTLVFILTPFYLGELLRGAAIARRYPALTGVVFWVWLAERASDVAALLIVMGFGTGRAGYAALGAALLLAVPWLVVRLTLRERGATEVHTGQLAIGSTVLICSALSLLAWMLPALSLFGLLESLGEQRSFSLAARVFASGTLFGGLTGVPGGFGATGASMITELMRAGVAQAEATAAILALRLGTQWFAVALGLVLAVLWGRQLWHLVRTTGRVQQHFDTLAPSYADNIPPHYKRQMLDKKIGAMAPSLPPPGRDVRALDLGCGQAWYASELARRGYTMDGVDLSEGQISEARRHCAAENTTVELRTYDGEHLPYPDASFDFVYSINVFHHVPGREAQTALMREVLRVLKPQGKFFLH